MQSAGSCRQYQHLYVYMFLRQYQVLVQHICKVMTSRPEMCLVSVQCLCVTCNAGVCSAGQNNIQYSNEAHPGPVAAPQVSPFAGVQLLPAFSAGRSVSDPVDKCTGQVCHPSGFTTIRRARSDWDSASHARLLGTAEARPRVLHKHFPAQPLFGFAHRRV